MVFCSLPLHSAQCHEATLSASMFVMPFCLFSCPHHSFCPSLQAKKLVEPGDYVRKVVFRIVTNIWFERMVIVLIIINIVFLSTEHYGQSVQWTLVQRYANDLITGIFVFELVVKIVGVCAEVTSK